MTNWVTDTSRPYFGVDSIVYEIEVPDGDGRVPQEDNGGAFDWSQSSWTLNPQNVSSYSGGNGHSTSAPDAWMTYTFEGTHVELYGTVGPDNGAYTVQVDDGDSTVLNGTKESLVTQTLLYQGTGLAQGKHTLRISNSPFSGQTLGIDYAVVYNSLGGGSGSTPLGAGTIGGIVVGSCGVVLIALFGVFFWYRRRSKRFEQKGSDNTPSPADYGTGPVTYHTPSLPTTVERYTPLPISSSTDTNLIQPHVNPNSTPSPPHSSSSASGSGSRTRLVLHNPNPSFGSGHGAAQGPVQDVPSILESIEPYQTPNYVTRPILQQESSSSRPPANHPTLASLAEDDLRAMRMQVEGRQQDFGPITFVLDSGHEGDLLPPDYNQATQPFPPRNR